MVVTGLLDSRAAGDSLGAQILHHAGLRGGPATWQLGPQGLGAHCRAAWTGCLCSSFSGRPYLLHTSPPQPEVRSKTQAGTGPGAGEPEAPCYQDPLWLRPKPQLQTEPSSILPPSGSALGTW